MFKQLAIASVVSIALYGCGAEERTYETVARAQEQITTQSLDTESLWLYMPSTGATPRYATSQRGFFQGTPKLVKLRFDDANGILAEEVDRDTIRAGKSSRYADVINQAPVLKIPGTFQQYRCAENDFDECTNKEELNKDADATWNTASHFTPDFAEIKSLAVDSVDAWYTSTDVKETAKPRLTHWEYDPKSGTINVEVERTFTADSDDAYKFGYDLDNLSFKTRFFYSLVKLDSIASKDYEKVLYPGRDSSRYGFFNDEKVERSATGEIGLQGQKFRLLNRFNPKKEIKYYLSDSYFEKGSELFLETTLETIKEINEVLEAGKTGVPSIKIVNEDTPKGIHTGDLRYNVLNLITDPVDSGLLGYGPSATNPLTGEIVHAHVNQYAGVIRASSRRMWNQLTMHYNRGEIDKPIAPVPAPQPPADTIGNVATNTGFAGVEDSLVANKTTALSDSTPFTVPNEPNFANGYTQWLTAGQQPTKSFSKQVAQRQLELDRMAENNMYSEEFMWVSTRSKGLVTGIDYLQGDYFDNSDLDPSASDYQDKVNTKLKKWSKLSAEQQKIVSNQISKHMYRSTLVHELGHNLGLRHNFMGSADKDNFYTQEEISALNYTKIPAHSSAMDYGASIFDELPIYGKYDVAALRFGYGRKLQYTTKVDKVNPETGLIEKVDVTKYANFEDIDAELNLNEQAYLLGSVKQLKETVFKNDSEAKFTNFDYCTDEHVRSNSTCNRFDEGSNILEQTKFRIQKYWDSYDLRNRRDDREQFYEYQVQSYAYSRWYEFNEIRSVVDDLGDIDYQLSKLRGSEDSYGKSVANYYTDNCQRADVRRGLPEGAKMVCDTFDASLLAANFFVEVMSKPDRVCEIRVSTNSGQITRFVPLSDLWSSYGPGIQDKTTLPESCFDKDLVAEMASSRDNITVLSETRDGRPYANMRANNPYNTSSTAVDQFGIWPDKLVAAQMLVKRTDYSSARDKSNIALLDVSSIHGSVQGTPQKIKTYLGYLGYGMDSFADPIFVDKDGERATTVTPYQPDIKRAIDVPPYLFNLKSFFQLSQNTVTPMFTALLNNLVAFGYAEEYGLADSSQDLLDDITLTRPNDSVDDKGSVTFSLKARNYVVTRRNGLAKNMAEKALLINGRQDDLLKLDDTNYITKQNLKANGVKTLNDFKLVMLRDTAAVGLLKKTSYFDGMFRATLFSPAKFTLDKDKKCYTVTAEPTRCNSKDNLHAAWKSLQANEDDETYLTALLNWADQYKDLIAEELKRNPQNTEIYDINPESIWLWSSREYIQYRYALEQLPVL
ncbi:zinc-dependent metalloprotease [Vibrio tapetis subsp. quintayensis]|uniref:zinc-dependent metalloprotease n=1 Tax=Vibrio tapetis TaxID=52443 RepID=UPI0025B43CAE|nr:zinc-dependent metalloprotease [Vibrio tapetis]MDN3681231.1 zinc-dependent metalloprotease [Vibrio tapetis subsp. quintayensis]